MLFHEIYGTYFSVVAAILAEAAEGPVDRRRMEALVQERAFGESGLAIPAALTDGTWPLLDGAGRSVLHHKPAMPLTTLEKRWLKALLSDPRIALFAPDTSGLDDVEPLYRREDFVFFDRYADGDPYEDPAYIAVFRTALQAIREKRRLRVRFRSRAGAAQSVVCLPYRLEYSQKDDKFRLLTQGCRRAATINLARVTACALLAPADSPPQPPVRRRGRALTLLLHDRRNGLERVLVHFSHLEKETQRLAEDLYRIRLFYDRNDETELLIRVLSFGPVLEVEGPESFRALVRERLARQLALTPQ